MYWRQHNHHKSTTNYVPNQNYKNAPCFDLNSIYTNGVRDPTTKNQIRTRKLNAATICSSTPPTNQKKSDCVVCNFELNNRPETFRWHAK